MHTIYKLPRILLFSLAVSQLACGTWVGNPDTDGTQFVSVQPAIKSLKEDGQEMLEFSAKNPNGSTVEVRLKRALLAVNGFDLLSKSGDSYQSAATVEGPFAIDLLSGA